MANWESARRQVIASTRGLLKTAHNKIQLNEDALKGLLGPEQREFVQLELEMHRQ